MEEKRGFCIRTFLYKLGYFFWLFSFVGCMKSKMYPKPVKVSNYRTPDHEDSYKYKRRPAPADIRSAYREVEELQERILRELGRKVDRRGSSGASYKAITHSRAYKTENQITEKKRRCQYLCRASSSICKSMQRICKIAQHFPKEKSFIAACLRAKATCKRENNSCQRCR